MSEANSGETPATEPLQANWNKCKREVAGDAVLAALTALTTGMTIMADFSTKFSLAPLILATLVCGLSSVSCLWSVKRKLDFFLPEKPLAPVNKPSFPKNDR